MRNCVRIAMHTALITRKKRSLSRLRSSARVSKRLSPLKTLANPIIKMINTLEINLNELDEFGEQISGEISPEIYQLPERDGKPLTGLKYDLYVQRFDNELLLRGKVSTQFELVCVRTLKVFSQTVTIDSLAISIEIKDAIVDPTEQLREEILVELPIDPRCDEGDEEMPCEIEEKYLALDKDQESDLEEKPADKPDDRWSALDQLDNL